MLPLLWPRRHKDHKLTGRIEVNTIGADANVKGKTASLDGSVSGNDLIVRPASIWLGGIEASGTYSSSNPQLTGKGFNITAERSSLNAYQDARVWNAARDEALYK